MKNINIKKYSILIITIFMIFSLTGCKKKDNVSILDKNTRGDLSISVPKEMLSYTNQCVEEFNNYYPNVRVSISLEKDISKDKKETDIIIIKSEHTKYFLSKFKDDFLNLEEFLSKYKKHFKYGSLENVSLDNVTYGIDLGSNPYLMIYKKDIYEKCNINLDDIKTWDNYVESSKYINKKLNKNYKFMHNYKNIDLYDIFLNQLGRGYKDEKGNETIISGESIRAIELLNIFNKNEMIYREENNSLIEALKSEEVVSTICTATDVYNIIEKLPSMKGDYTIKRIPAFILAGNRNVSKNEYSLLVFEGKNNKASRTFLKFIIENEKLQEKIFKDEKVLPFNINVYKSKSLNKKEDFFNGENIFELVYDVYRKSPNIKYNEDYEDIRKNINKTLKFINDEEVDTEKIIQKVSPK
ncbi:ABC transporter substrate-binding protein [Clostridium cochlearium]|uniref:ABC transporter substrate-binding protein n=1 Tax=Clostridium cochlearium TaxID=1494 RepID=A0A1G9IP02_CLOCO|nr:ABC transporter substrate-binding protein [Clostridium cochlearium]MBU5269948.1 ABC transporter substrate-binding protein [Clostridium cochlearium]MCG4579619.1 ABC transporter substrate-binding protein [Clostridium cochlearium]SDL26756.1 carbohydrate ABC transporter substrate-binding protein, CUT1 family [Clostridium cochlearium]SQB34361.1 ABC transporter substrate-binding protein [Clostridium cochlearium]